MYIRTEISISILVSSDLIILSILHKSGTPAAGAGLETETLSSIPQFDLFFTPRDFIRKIPAPAVCNQCLLIPFVMVTQNEDGLPAKETRTNQDENQLAGFPLVPATACLYFLGICLFFAASFFAGMRCAVGGPHPPRHLPIAYFTGTDSDNQGYFDHISVGGH
jgi:hypothetical protein